MKSVVINYKDAVGVGNLSALFWTLHGSLENANKEVSENEEKVLAHFFKKINKDLIFPSASVLAGDKKPSIRKGQRNKPLIPLSNSRWARIGLSVFHHLAICRLI